MTHKPTITDDMLRAAVRAIVPERIVGFSSPANELRTRWGPPHYVQDVRLRRELWRGDSHAEMMERCEMERMRLALMATGVFGERLIQEDKK